MSPTLPRIALVAAAALAVLGFLIARRDTVSAQAPAAPALVDDSVASFRVQFGVTDTGPRAWDGSLTASAGAVQRVRNWHPRPDDVVEARSWKLSTRRGINFVARPWDTDRPTPPVPYMLIPGIIVDVRGHAGTRVRIETPQGAFDVPPFALEAAAPASFLGGAVLVDRVPAATTLSGGERNAEFPAIVAGANGELWSSWVAFTGGRNQVEMRHFDGRAWGPAQTVSGDHRDIFLVKMTRDRAGRLWVFWSAQVDGNFDIYARRWDGKAWSAIERLTRDPLPDIYHNVATDSNGSVWVVWQGFRQGASDIFARRYDGSAWLAEEKVSTSPANDWTPAIAADGAGRVWVGWDTYDKGNYDVLVRRYENGGWSNPIPVASTPLFEAHVSLACDNQNRLWAAWNESGAEWGKDTGFLLKIEGTRLYASRWMSVRVFDGAAWQQPADVERALPEDLRGYNDMPSLTAASDGRVWLFFRHRMLRVRDTPSDSPAHRAAWEVFGTSYQGDRWTTPVHFPSSQGRNDMVSGFAADARGNVYAAWPNDGRDFETYLNERVEILAARVPAPSGAPAVARLTPYTPPQLNAPPLKASEPEDLARIRGYEIKSQGQTYRIYRGDTHRHTEFSMDGNNDGSLLDAYRYAIDAASLDSLGVSEHNSLGGQDNDYINWRIQQSVDLFSVSDKFVPIYTYERSAGYPNGHRNVIFAKRGNPTLPLPVEEQKGITGAKSLYAYLKKYSGIAISHTSATNMGTDWRDNDPEVEPLVEIYQGDRVSAEYEGAPKAATAAKPSGGPGGFRPAGYVWNAWAKGYKLGVQSSSDHLSTHISYACTIASSFTKQGLLDAMRARHSYAATDNIILDYRLETGGREYLQGDIVKASGGYRLVVKVIGSAPVRQIDIIRNNTFVHTRHPMQSETNFTFSDSEAPAGESYYYVRVIQVDDEMAWSSPIWVTR